MINIKRVYIFLGLTALVAVMLFWFSSHRPQAVEPEKIDTDAELPDRNIVRIQVDSLSSLIRLIYDTDAAIALPDSEAYVVKIHNQGNEISNFYNDNPRLLETKDKRFAIKRNGNSIEANFVIERINNQKYAVVPTDVVYKLAELAYNK